LLNVPDVLAVLDNLGVILAVSPALYERTGYEPKELVGKHVSRVELFGQDRRLVVDDLRLLDVQGGEGAREFVLRCRDGGRAWGEVRMHALPLGNGDSLRRIVLYDVTRRHIAEARQAELEIRVEQSRRLETVGLLAGGVAHDFNNLLTVILALGSLLDEKLQADSPARQLLTEINESAVRAAELARNLLHAEPRTSFETLAVERELAELSPMLSRMVGDPIRLAMRIHADPCLVRMDKISLERIATNLIINAREAMPNGGEIVVAIAPSSDVGGGEASRRVIELSVADTGVGMDSATRQRIFEPFYTTKGEAGTGLGLATVEGIVTRLGGSIVVDSRPGRGTTVRVFLPEASSDGVSSPSTAYEIRPE
jgi:PAS domain S-box-containing protein